ncbi:transmembrane channel-like protein 7 [Biomphalaria glabrata]|uniref:Transmembrane channel-like protein 7 n=1 Tax=Biomphalaria glabrata TaxID=6526 RepID=A0A9W2ZPX5_BIOGL|nr:transmembrane channel-like protein 7 [Biomphalaria glabrata]
MPLSRQNKVSPLSTDVKVSQPNNVDGASKSPGDDLDKQIQEIRDLARPLAVKRDLYHKLLIQSPGSSTLASRQRNSVRAKTRFLYQHWSNVRYSLTPWGRSLKTIEGKHGAGVASYFQFLRWIFGLNVLLFLLFFSFVVLPMAIGDEVPLDETDGFGFNTSALCSLNYSVEIGSGVDHFLSALDGTGWLEKTLLFYGYYSVRVTVDYTLPVAYVMTVLCCLVVSLVLMVRYTAWSLKETVLKSVNSNIEQFSKVYTAWDYTLTNPETAWIKKDEIFKDFEAMANEKLYQTKRQHRFRSTLFVCRLYLVRGLVNVMIAASLAGAGYLIYYVTAFSTEYGQENQVSSGTSSWLLLLVNYLPSITITFCNAALPLAYEFLVKLEDYSGHVVVKLTLIRTVVLRLASLVVLCITMYTQINCGSTDACGISTTPACTPIKCWETSVESPLYTTCNKTLYTTCNKTLYTTRNKTLFTTCNKTLYTTQNKTLYTTCNKTLYTTCNKTLYTTCNKTLYTTQNKTLYTTCNKTLYTTCNKTLYTTRNKSLYTTRNKTLYTTCNKTLYTTCNKTLYTTRNKTLSHAVAILYCYRFLTFKFDWWILRSIGPAEFNIPSNVMDLIYGQCLVWLGMLFSPLLPGIVVVKCFLVFYTKKLSALVACPPIKSPYRTSGINRFFMFVLMLAFTLCSLPVLYSIFGFHPSRSCGPFRVQDYMHDCIKTSTSTLPSVLSKSYNFVTSIAVTGSIIIILLVIIYYKTYVTSAHRENAQYYKQQLMRNGKFSKGLGSRPNRILESF